MSEFGKQRIRGRQKYDSSCKFGAVGAEGLEKLDQDSVIIQNFKKYAQELDKRHDKFERIVKLSRDITIESKRIIFLLHTIDRESKRSSVLNEAELRLNGLISHQWQLIAKELQQEDSYQFNKAFSPGMQEFVESLTFCNYLRHEKFPHWDTYQNKLTYNNHDQPNDNLNEISVTKEPIMYVRLIPVDYILGLADVTGELMRKCINNLGEGDVQGCYKTCNFVRNLYSGFLSISLFGNREMSRKAFTLKQSLLKMEIVCYNIHVRGSEIPRHMLADVDVRKTYPEEDEGFFD